MAKIDITNTTKKYPTVGEMLEYIKSNNIPMDAIVTCEQLKDYYLEDKEDYKSWDYYETSGDYPSDVNKLLPAHNGFGSAFFKKAFVIWMHF